MSKKTDKGEEQQTLAWRVSHYTLGQEFDEWREKRPFYQELTLRDCGRCKKRVTIAHHRAVEQVSGYHLARYLRELFDWPKGGARKMTQTDKDVDFMTLYCDANKAKRFLDKRGDEVKNVAKTVHQMSRTELFSQHLFFFECRPQLTVVDVFHYYALIK